VDRWQIASVTAPSHFFLDLGSAQTGTGAPEGKRANSINILSPNEITPETENTCHVFYAHCRNFALGDPGMRETIRQDMLTAYREDWVMIEAQQQIIDRDPERPMLILGQDAGVAALRRIINLMIAEEQGGDVMRRAEAAPA
jgi:vanillate O-demethylase monooxygenase subunit